MLSRLLRSICALFIVAAPAAAIAQSAVIQGGQWSAGRAPMYSISGGSQPIVQDSGPAGGGAVGYGLSELNITARGTGTAPFIGQGSGPDGTVACTYDGPTTGQHHYLCWSANVASGGLLTYGAAGGAAAQPLNFKINGTTYQFPFTSGAVIGPGASTVGHAVCWNNLVGTLLSDCGTFPAIGGAAGQVQYNNAGVFGGFTVGGDGTLNTGTGVLTVTKLNTVPITLGGNFTTGGAFTTTGVFSINFTTTGNTALTLPTTGTLGTLAGIEALTNKTYNGNTWTAGTGTLTLGAGKTLTASNTITFTATDGSTLAIGTGGTLGTAAYTAATAYMASGTQLTNSLAANVALNNVANFFDGPSVAQGATGTWFASGTVTLADNVGAAQFQCKLWDGTTVISDSASTSGGAAFAASIALSGFIASPAGNIRISCRDINSVNGIMYANNIGLGHDSVVTVFRLQ